MIALDWTQLLSVALAIAAIIFAVKEIKVYPGAAYWLIPIIVSESAVLIFYLLVNIGRLNILNIPITFTEISSWVRLVGQICICGVVVTWHQVHKYQNRGRQ